MKQNKFFKKPLMAVIAFILIGLMIIYIEAQKPDMGDVFVNNSSGEIFVPKSEYAGPSPETAKEKNFKYRKAPEVIGIERWINSEPLKLTELRGKVVLIDFWTYTCINCIRTLPYLKSWDGKYSDKGLVIIGVHSPEFEFEKKYENVLNFVNEYNIKYAVAQDNNYATWQNYQNRYWPHKFLIDIDGYIVYDHIGEGDYDKTELKIQELLNERMQRLKAEGRIDEEITKPNATTGRARTPEIYFGYRFATGERLESHGNIDADPDEIKNYRVIGKIEPLKAYLNGQWKNNEDNMELMSDTGEIILVYDAKSVNIVAGSDFSSNATIMLDNSYLDESTKGNSIYLDGNKSISKVDEFQLYNLANAPDYGEHFLSIKVKGKGFKIFTFTFG